MPRKTKQKQEVRNESVGGADKEAPLPTAGENGPQTPPGGLKEFVDEYKDNQHRIVESRIAIVCSFGVFGKVLFSDTLAEMDKDSTTYAALTFVALCVLVIIFNTWLDYFPSRLKNVQLRVTKGQGLPLACLLLPMVCAASLHCSLYSNKQFIDLLFLYLVVLCQLSVCSILATMFHFIPYPSSILFYNFASIGISYGFQAWIGIPMWISLPAIAVYSIMVPWFLYTFPSSFSLGEAVIVSQGLTMMFVDTTLQLVHLHDLVSLPPYLTAHRNVSILYVELLLAGVCVCCILLSPALYKIASSRDYYERKFWSGTFILLSLSIGFVMILPWLGALNGGHNAIAFVLFYMSTSYTRLGLVVYWLLVSIATGILVGAQSSTSSWAQPLKAEQPSSLWMRKWFHLSALAVFIPGLVVDVDFLSFSASMVTFLFVVAELMRIFKMWPGGESLRSVIQPMCDNRDSGSIVLSHLYLLAGFSLPLWLSPLRQYNTLLKLSLYSGALALGVGDSVAAISGQLIGKLKWPGTRKTVEGTLMSVLTQILTVFIIVLIDQDIPFPSLSQWAIVSGGTLITAILEAYTWQIDNLILGLFQFAIFISFL